MTANIFLAGTFWAVVGGLYWRHAHRLGAYCSLIFGASCTLIYFFVPDPRGWTGAIGVLSYVFAFVGMVAGSLIGSRVTSQFSRIALLGALIVTCPLGFRYIQIAVNEGRLWIDIWILVMIGASLLLLGISTLAIVKGFNDIKRMFSALMRGERDTNQERE
jgi:Na+/proline symporter